MNKQRGISMIVVLIGLVIISFAAISLLRSTDTATLIAGNLGFKKAALASGDAGTEAAITWLNANATSATLRANLETSGYYATSADACDLTGSRTPDDATDDVNWTGTAAAASCNMYGLEVTPPGVENGFAVRYVINRMCNAEGDANAVLAADGATAMICSRSDLSTTEGSTRLGPCYGCGPFAGGSRIYYRITTRVTGPRNSVRYVQAFVVL